MLAVQIGILLTIVGLIVLGVWMVRLSKRYSAEAEAAMAVLADTLGAPRPPRKQRTLQGQIAGRPCRVAEVLSPGTDDADYSTRLEVAIDTPVTLELHGQTSSLGARLVGDVEIGDAEFDKWFIVRTNDTGRVAAALTPELRTQLIDWYRHGWVIRVWIMERLLKADVGEGLQQARHIECAGRILRALAQLADGLEGRPPGDRP